MALLHLVYRDKLFPRQECRRAFEALIDRLSERQACKITVELLALTHERNCERALTAELAKVLEAGGLPDLAVLRRHFAPDPACLPAVTVQSVSLDSYEALVKTADAAGVPA